jgi:hypothetical protein
MALSYPEGASVQASDDDQRSLHKANQLYYDTYGPKPSPFAEGLAPTPADDPFRSWQKIKRLLEV